MAISDLGVMLQGVGVGGGGGGGGVGGGVGGGGGVGEGEEAWSLQGGGGGSIYSSSRISHHNLRYDRASQEKIAKCLIKGIEDVNGEVQNIFVKRYDHHHHLLFICTFTCMHAE